MANWRDELIEAVKTKVEREAEEAERQRLRVQEALGAAEAALSLGATALQFAHERIKEKGQETTFEQTADSARLSIGKHALHAELDRLTAVIKVAFRESKAREFDFARDRHIAAADIEEYLGRRALELVRAIQKETPW